MTYAGWHIAQLKFTGKGDKEALLNFAPGLSLIYGASNTGKSFAVKALDFMLGGQKELPLIKEREPYNRLWLDVAFSPDHKVSLERAIVGGAFKLHEGDHAARTLAAKHDAKDPQISRLFCSGRWARRGARYRWTQRARTTTSPFATSRASCSRMKSLFSPSIRPPSLASAATGRENATS